MKQYITRDKSVKIQVAILDIFGEQKPKLTVRQIFYALSVRGLIPKTEPGYRQACYQLRKMRERSIIPYGWIADNTRWQIKPETDTGLESAITRWQQSYRRDLWANQPVYIEIWVEKDALAGVVSSVTQDYDVPLHIARGYSSLTQLYDAAEFLKLNDKPTYIYHFGDFDPSGVDAAHKIEEGLRYHGAKISFERVAITSRQIYELDLPTRETKKRDPRSKKWGDLPSVELDALPAPVLRNLVRQCIERHIDQDLLKKTRQIEHLERTALANIRKNFVHVQNSYVDGATP